MMKPVRCIWTFILGIILTNSSSADGPPLPAKLNDLRLDVELTSPSVNGTASLGQPTAGIAANVNISFAVSRQDKQKQFAYPILLNHVATSPKPKVKIGGELVKSTVSLLRSTAQTAGTGKASNSELPRKKLLEWIQQDPVLARLVNQYESLRGDLKTLTELRQQLDEELKTHLVESDRIHAARYVASGDNYFPHLVKFMPEVDPDLRVNEPYKRWKYISLLDEYQTSLYGPYEKKWRREAERWFDRSPTLRTLADRYQEISVDLRSSDQLMDREIMKHLHDARGLSLKSCVRFRNFLQHAGSNPHDLLISELFPELAEQRQQQQVFERKQLRKWGFDQSVVSPFTGTLIPEKEVGQWTSDWRDSSVKAMLGRANANSHSRRPARPVSAPAVIEFEIPETVESPAAVSITYSTLVANLLPPMSSGFPFANPELVVVTPVSKEKVPFRIFVPSGMWTVVSPNPANIRNTDAGTFQIDGVLADSHSALHVKPVLPDRYGEGYLTPFSRGNDQTLADLQTLIRLSGNQTALPITQMAMYRTELRHNLIGAFRRGQALVSQHPAVENCFRAFQSRLREVKTAQELHDWFQQKAESPTIQTDEDFARFKLAGHGTGMSLTDRDLQELANRVSQTDKTELSVEEQYGRLFILCCAGRGVELHLGEIVNLAKQKPSTTVSALRTIEHLSIDKSSALPFVLEQLSANQQKDEEGRKIRNAAYGAMRTFRTPDCATELIAFIESHRDSLLVQGAIDALSAQTLPKHFDRLVAVDENVAASSESAFIQYINLLIRSNRNRAIEALQNFDRKYPKYHHRILVALGKAEFAPALSKAMEIYRNPASSKQDLAAAVSVIGERASGDDIATLPYREGLEKWMNERLVAKLPGETTNAESFEFVAAFYREFIQGQKSFHHLTCVSAFERIRNPEGIPYLQEILRNTERKQDAAHAIGKLTLIETWQQSEGEQELDNAIRTILNPATDEAESASAWHLLLAQKEKSFARLINYGPLRTALIDTNPAETPVNRKQLLFIRRFDDVAISQLLAQATSASLEQRYVIADILQIFLPESEHLLKDISSNSKIDADQRRAAKLALRRYAEESSR